MTENDDEFLCGAPTKSGKPCRNLAVSLVGGDRGKCHVHQSEDERIFETAANKAVGRLIMDTFPDDMKLPLDEAAAIKLNAKFNAELNVLIAIVEAGRARIRAQPKSTQGIN
jgi:hypothetical protein